MSDLKVTVTFGRAMAQAVSRRPLTAETRVRSRVRPCGICGFTVSQLNKWRKKTENKVSHESAFSKFRFRKFSNQQIDKEGGLIKLELVSMDGN
jgi:hypothetical protein